MGEEEEWIMLKIPKHEENKSSKQEKTHKKKSKKEISVLIAAALPLLLIVYVIYMQISPFGYTKTYTLQVGGLEDNNTRNDIYIASWKGSPQMRVGTSEFRMLNGEAIIMFKPQISLDKAKAYVTIDFTGNNTLYIKNNDTWEVYWNPNWDKYSELYSFTVTEEDVAYLHNPANLKKGDVVQVKMNSNYSHTDADKPATLSEWLAENADESLYFYNLGFKNYENDALEYNPGPTVINTTLRGTHRFYVYLDDKLDLTVWKKDLNSYNGKDDMNITLTDFDGTVVYNEMFYDDDDGNISVLNAKNKSVLKLNEKVQAQNFYYDGLVRGVYLLTVNSVKGQNKNEDGSIANLSINTDKIVVTDYLYPLTKVKLYTETAGEKQLEISYSSSGSNQNLTIQGNELQVINLTKNESGKKQTITMKGKSWLMTPKGNVVITGNMQFAFDEKNYFKVFEYELNEENPNYMILTNNKYPVLNQNISINAVNDTITGLSVNVKR